ncbi:Flp pilus assembly protein CpaB [Salipiger sp. CCB-MM3]|uniref:Flp pilus assembly protein CpaB n=1 Tax=Salipiger sp. CCB-MM3 TaxID=1792508 RepID=UPI0009F5BE7A|nr:Flp pilus assembly protein CpaB [Salipiger sp. CCB-MM3]
MKFSMVLSLVVAVLLAGAAVYGARDWLAQEQRRLNSQTRHESPSVPEMTVVVAVEPITFGERLSATKLRTIAWSSDITPEGSFTSIEDVIGQDDDNSARFALTTMAPGEPILATKITLPGQRAKLSTALTPGMKAVSIRVNDVLGVAGFVLPGDRVDVMLTRGGRGEQSFVDILLQGVKVLAIDQIADELKDKPSVVRTVTFEVNTTEAQKLVLAGNVGTLSLALRNVGSNDIENNDRITMADLTEFDVAEDLAPVVVKAEPSVETRKLDAMEVLLKSTLDGISDRLTSVEDKIQKPEPTEVEKIVERVVIAPPVPAKKATVAVIRNGRRDVYKVEPSSAGSYGVDPQLAPELVSVQLEN